jgi:hypothetical protein
MSLSGASPITVRSATSGGLSSPWNATTSGSSGPSGLYDGGTNTGYGCSSPSSFER